MVDCELSLADHKRQIAQQFSKAARRYDSIANVQLEIGLDALKQFPHQGQTLLDIGCGTGRLTRHLAEQYCHTLAIDLAHGMVLHATSQTNDCRITYVTADAEALPLSAHSVDGVFSSMALQWCQPLARSFAEMFRVLKPGGKGLICIMCEGSMAELRQCWEKLGKEPRMNHFDSAVTIANAARQVGFDATVKQQAYQSMHLSLLSLFNSIRRIGAGVVTQDTQHDNLNRQDFRRMESLYRLNFELDGQLPLTYQVCFLELVKPL